MHEWSDVRPLCYPRSVPAKDPVKRRATMRAWYARTKHLRADEKAARIKRNRDHQRERVIEWYAVLKSQLQCRRCGEAHPACLQFHHSDPAQKEMSIADAISRRWSIKRLIAEVEKCEVLCANCHAKHHAREPRDG